MSKYKVGDKVVVEITDILGVMGEPWYVLSEATSMFASYLEKAAEPLSNYTEPLEAKIRRQAAEITRLLAENKGLKNKEQELARERNQLMGRCGGLSNARIKEFNKGRIAGQNEAWKLARKIVLLQSQGGMNNEDYKGTFGSGVTEKYIMKNFTYSEAAAKVEAWEKAKPLRTIFDDFLEKYPNALVNDERVPYTCPYTLGYGEKIKDCTKKMNCFDCWNRPLEQIGEE